MNINYDEFWKRISKGTYKTKQLHEFDIKKNTILENQYNGVKCKVLGVYNNVCFVVYHDKVSLQKEFGSDDEMKDFLNCIDTLIINDKFFYSWELVKY